MNIEILFSVNCIGQQLLPRSINEAAETICTALYDNKHIVLEQYLRPSQSKNNIVSGGHLGIQISTKITNADEVLRKKHSGKVSFYLIF